MSFQYWTIAIGIISALVSLYVAISTVNARNRKIVDLFTKAYEDEDADAVIKAEKVLALEKLKNTTAQKRHVLLANITYVEEIGSKEPFYEGFDTLAVELSRNKNLEVRLRIVKALYKLSTVIEKEKKEKFSE